MARLHVIALLAPEVQSQRIYAFAGPIRLHDIIAILRKLRPENKLIPNAPADEGHDLTEVALAPKAEELLREYFGQDGWISLSASIEAGIQGV